MKKFFKFSAVILLITFLNCCCFPPEQEQITIAVSKNSPNYEGWLKRFNDNVDVLNLYTMGMDSAQKVLQTVDAVLISGGGDVYPDNYGRINDTSLCGGFDFYRDSLEFLAIEYAIKNKIPLLGICRGEQIINIALGGSLYADVPTQFDSSVTHSQEDWRNCYHNVNIVDNSWLRYLSSVEYGKVTSNHHQGIRDLGEGLKISAYANDSLPEAIEWADTSGKAFMLAVQWHPERMDTLHLLSAPILKEFIASAEKSRN